MVNAEWTAMANIIKNRYPDGLPEQDTIRYSWNLTRFVHEHFNAEIVARWDALRLNDIYAVMDAIFWNQN